MAALQLLLFLTIGQVAPKDLDEGGKVWYGSKVYA